jgi:hypothetical protein
VKAGLEPRWDRDSPGFRRFYVSDPVGNRLEFLELLLERAVEPSPTVPLFRSGHSALARQVDDHLGEFGRT